jgi:ATP-dependent Clp protease ATP-binding subunit ClpC
MRTTSQAQKRTPVFFSCSYFVKLLLSLRRTQRKTVYPASEASPADLNFEVLEVMLQERLIGQPRAMARVVEQARVAKLRSRFELDESTKSPALTLFFLGPPGVGKTLTASIICEAFTGDPANLRRVDCAEYQHEGVVSRLLGAEPGYVGYAEAGQVTSWIANQARPCLMFEDLEKAHGSVLDVILHALDCARMFDAAGRLTDMSHSVLMFTSALGVSAAIEGKLYEKRFCCG